MISYKDAMKQFLGKWATDDHTVHTPIELTDSIVHRVMSYGKLKGNILVLANVEWLKTLDNLDLSECNIYFITPCANKATFAKRFNKNIHVSIMEWDTFFKEDFGMKFDVVLGNPPYNKGMWLDFFRKMAEMSTESVISINPDPSRNITTRGREFKSFLLENGIQHRADCTDAFDVNTGNISYFILDKTKQGNEAVFDATSTDQRILDKVLIHKTDDGTLFASSVLKPASIELSDDVTPYKVIANIIKDGIDIKYTDKKYTFLRNNTVDKVVGKVFVLNRFFGKNKVDPVELVDLSDTMCSSKVLMFKGKDSDTVNGFNSLYQSPLYKMLISTISGGQAIRDKGLSLLPHLDCSREWTDAELYTHFNLTQEEIDYVESTVK